MIDLSRMNRVEIDSARRVAHAQAGALVRDMDRATQRFGLASTMGGALRWELLASRWAVERRRVSQDCVGAELRSNG